MCISFCSDTMKSSVVHILCAVVLCVSIPNRGVQGGYYYHKPSIPFHLPNTNNLKISSEENRKTNHYSIEHENHSYLQQYKNEIQFNMNSAHQNLKISGHQDLTSLGQTTTELNANIDASASAQNTVLQNPLREQNHINVQAILNTQNDARIQNKQDMTYSPIAYQNIHNKLLDVGEIYVKQQTLSGLNLHDNYNSVVNVQSNLQLPCSSAECSYQTQYGQRALQSVVDVTRPSLRPVLNLQPALSAQNNIGTQLTTPQISQDHNIWLSSVGAGTQTNESNVLKQSSDIQYSQNILPVVTKQITFHVPPPDIEESPVLNVQPPKKSYKIIFIKLPAQENSKLQLKSVEDKTIIYVLSKKSETPSALPPKASEHEVFFVKYKENSERNI